MLPTVREKGNLRTTEGEFKGQQRLGKTQAKMLNRQCGGKREGGNKQLIARRDNYLNWRIRKKRGRKRVLGEVKKQGRRKAVAVDRQDR